MKLDYFIGYYKKIMIGILNVLKKTEKNISSVPDGNQFLICI
ncbi:hypothetical protein CAEBREN_28342 [Caenorhabditis brenneri]|uniref:Uncharacterized protein n=1 Tax=Caenorhabditis brenneri TaxID=135651 RepID=G0PF75_CAEBE|nr:hypothetical protein CAEBREN_28342 [Caenorhabditis brenneri]